MLGALPQHVSEPKVTVNLGYKTKTFVVRAQPVNSLNLQRVNSSLSNSLGFRHCDRYEYEHPLHCTARIYCNEPRTTLVITELSSELQTTVFDKNIFLSHIQPELSPTAFYPKFLLKYSHNVRVDLFVRCGLTDFKFHFPFWG